MAKKKTRRKTKPKLPEAILPPEEPAEQVVEVPAKNFVPLWRRCPICWGNYGGKAKRKEKSAYRKGNVMHYVFVCDQCGFNFQRSLRKTVLLIGNKEVRTTEILELNQTVMDEDEGE